MSKTQYSILGWLSHGPKSAYDIKKWLTEITQHFWAESDGQLYPTLSKLQQEGAVELIAGETNSRQRKVYKITSKGQHILNEWLEEPPATNIVRNEFLLKLFFGSNLPSSVSMQHLRRELHRCEDRLVVVRLKLKRLSAMDLNDNIKRHSKLTIEYGLMVLETKIKFSQHALEVLSTDLGS